MHKYPISTRPVCSDCASLPHALGQWVGEQLQPIVKAQTTNFKNSFELKQELDTMTLPANASLFTYDAVLMYTNINTDDCIKRLSKFLSAREQTDCFPHYSPKALTEAIILVMRNNRMRFSDTLMKQISGIAGDVPSTNHLQTFLRYLQRFIDDVFGIWLHDLDPAVFQATVNNGGLEWTFSKRSQSVVFMDMTIEIVGGKIMTSLYAKPLALYLYIPPHSCHTPG
ncbi:hypothetical protein ACHAXR_001344, partial [Thalassiosira sp. AJA248-18]